MRLVLACLLVSHTALAAPLEIHHRGDGTNLARQPVPATATARAYSRTIYLDRHGGLVSPGTNDSSANTSTIVTRPTQLAGWDASDAEWELTVRCMRQLWSRFDVVVTDVDPGPAPHIEAMFGDSSTTLGLPARVGGVAPMAVDCGVVERAIVFAFTDNLSRDPQTICEAMSQEIGHSYGLDHELAAADPMTYLPYGHDRSFQDQTVSCGETTARPCGIAGHVCRPDQNTVQLLLERLGPAGADSTAPILAVSSPADGAVVEPGFAVIAQASDNIGVTAVALYVDGALVTTRATPPFELATDPDLAPGPHTLRVEATDALENLTTSELVVRIDPGSADPLGLGCTAGGSPGPTGVALLVLAIVPLRRRRRATPTRR
jgi:MYXO-CTERM domain-containing protein